jgi:hypothetical protein
VTYSIIDCDENTTSKLSELKAAGIKTVIRYDDRFPSGNWKQVHSPEVHAIRDAGFELGIVYEGAGATLSSFSEQSGYLDAQYARKQAALRGQPDGSAELFAVDFDPTASEITARIIPYFNGVAKAFAESNNLPVLVPGVYGSGLTCRTLFLMGLAKIRWITCSRGFQGSAQAVAAGEYELWQEECEKKLEGLDVDYSVAKVENWGQFVPWGAPTVPAVIPPPPTISHDIRWLQGVLQTAGLYHGAIDGDPGPLTEAAMIAYAEQKGAA